MIIDCHTHLNRYAAADPPTLAERLARLRHEMEGNGVAHALVLTSYDVNEDRPGVAEVAAALAGDPRFTLVGGVDCREGAPRNLPELREHLQAGVIRALKLYPGYQPFQVSDDALRPVLELAGEFGVPVMVHTGDTFDPGTRVRRAHPLTVDDAAVDFRDVTFVMCHTGSPWFPDAMEVLYKNHNVVADISGLTLGVFQPRYAAFARARLNDVAAYVNRPDKLLFGTDWPICEVAGYLEFAASLDLTPEEREGLMWRNAARVFGIGGANADG